MAACPYKLRCRGLRDLQKVAELGGYNNRLFAMAVKPCKSTAATMSENIPDRPFDMARPGVVQESWSVSVAWPQRRYC